MFGKRTAAAPAKPQPQAAPAPDVKVEAATPGAAAPAPAPTPASAPAKPKLELVTPAPVKPAEHKPADGKLQEIKVAVFNDLLEAVDLKQLGALKPDAVREEISDIVGEIIGMRALVLSAQEQ